MNLASKSKLIFILYIFGSQFFLKSEEYKNFLVIISSDNKHLENVFEQNYSHFRVVCIDSTPIDSEFLEFKNCSDKLTIALPTLRSGRIGALWSIIHAAGNEEIIIDLDTNKFFLDSNALATFNDLYQKNNIWMTVGYLCNYDDASLFDPKNMLDQNPWRLPNIGLTEPITFYAWLFKQIKLEDFTKKNNFLLVSTTSMFYPMLEMARNHLIFLSDSSIGYEARDIIEKDTEFLPQEYEMLSAKPCSTKSDSADLVVFSYNRPMQLYAFLESLERYVTGLDTVSVIYRSANELMKKAYKQVIKKFPNVKFIKQKHSLNGADFREKTLKATFETSSNYIIFAVDDIIIKDYCDMSECISYLKKTHAYGFYLRLGDNINHFYILDKPQIQPPLLPLDDKIYAWRFNSGGGWDWGCLASVDMTLHEKKLIKDHLESLNFDRPNYFEGAWSNSSTPLLNSFGLCYRSSKIVNLPLNKVQSDGAKNMAITANELLYRFNEGYKIDIDPLHKINNQSVHMEYVPTYVKR